MEKLEPSDIAGGSAKWCSCFGRQFPIWVLKMLPYDPSSFALGYILKRNENVCSDENLYTNDHCSIIHNIPKREMTQMSISCWTDSQMWYTRTMEYYLIVKKNEVLTHDATWMNIMLKTLCCVREARRKKPHIVCFHLYKISRTDKSTKTESTFVVAKAWRRSGSGRDC